MADLTLAAMIVELVELEELAGARPRMDLNAIHARHNLNVAEYYMAGNFPVLYEAHRCLDTARYYLVNLIPVQPPP